MKTAGWLNVWHFVSFKSFLLDNAILLTLDDECGSLLQIDID